MRMTVAAPAAFLALLVLPSASSAGELRTDEIDSKALAQKMKVNVLLPDGYAADERRYPVVYLLHGYGGDYTEWQRVGVEKEAAGLPVIVVMPEGDKSFYVNHHEDPAGRWEDYIVQEVVAHVDSRYRTVPERASRAISGLSMGGYGALMVGMRHPDLFAAVASHSGALAVPGKATQGEIAERVAKVFGPEGSGTRKTYDLNSVAKGLPREKRPAIYLDCGSRDFLLEWNRDFVRELSGARIDYEYRELPGAHDHAYWKANVRYSLERQLEALSRAREVAAAPKAAGAPTPTESGDLRGEWKMVVDFNGQEADYKLQLKGSGESLEGVLVSPRSGDHSFQKITWKDGALRMEILRDYQGTKVKLIYDGKLSGTALEGKVAAEGFEDQFQGKWKAERAAEKL